MRDVAAIYLAISDKSTVCCVMYLVKGRSAFRAKAAAASDDFQGLAGEGGRQNESAILRGT